MNPGFSEDDTPVAIGYLQGLRWFTVCSHVLQSVEHTRPGLMVVTCNCGERMLPEDWHSKHQGAGLRGSRGDWAPGVNHAACLTYGTSKKKRHNVRHDVPVKDCGCGFWAYWRLSRPWLQGPRMAAVIKGYGRYVRGPEGFRCATAEFVALAAQPESLQYADMVQKAYGVPVYCNVTSMLASTPRAPDGQPPLSGGVSGGDSPSGNIYNLTRDLFIKHRPGCPCPPMTGTQAQAMLEARKQDWRRDRPTKPTFSSGGSSVIYYSSGAIVAAGGAGGGGGGGGSAIYAPGHFIHIAKLDSRHEWVVAVQRRDHGGSESISALFDALRRPGSAVLPPDPPYTRPGVMSPPSKS